MNFWTLLRSISQKPTATSNQRYKNWHSRTEIEELEHRWLLDADFGLTSSILEINAQQGGPATQTLTVSQEAHDLGNGLTLAYRLALSQGQQWIGANVPGSISGAGTSDLLVARSAIDATSFGLLINGASSNAAFDVEIAGIRAISNTNIQTAGSVMFSGESGFSGDLTISANAITDAAGTEISATGQTTLTSDHIVLGDSANDELWLQRTAIVSDGLVDITNSHLKKEAVLSSFGPSGFTFLGGGGGGGAAVTTTTQVTMTGAGNFSFTTPNNIELIGTSNVGGDAELIAAGVITDVATADITVVGNFNMEASAITLGDDADNNHLFGSLSFHSVGDVSISEDDDMLLTGVACGENITLESETGTLTDTPGAQVLANSLARFIANDATNGTISIGDVADATSNVTQFGSVSFASTGAVTIHEDDDMTISENAGGDDNIVGDTLTVSAAGDIDNSAGTTLSVTNNAQFAANNIFLGDQAGDSVTFGSFNFASTGDVEIEENDGLEFGSAINSTAGSLTATSVTGAITNDAAANVSVTGNASFTGTSVTLSDAATFNFGSVTADATGDVTIFEDSDAEIAGQNLANNFSLTAAGQITDATGSQLLINGNLALTTTTPGDGIVLADDSINIGISASITLNTLGTVIIDDNFVGDLDFSGANNIGGDLVINLPGGNVIDTGATTTLDVTGNASFTTLNVTLGDEGVGNVVNFGTLTFNANDVSIIERSDVSVTGVNTANSLILQSTGNLDFATTSLDVIGNAALNAVNITGDLIDNLTFGSLTLIASNDITLTEADDMVLTGTNSAVNLMLTSTGSITDSGPSNITATGMATFTGTFVELGDQANETLTLTGTLGFDVLGDFTLDNGANNIVLKGTNSANSLDLTTTGTITDDSSGGAHTLTVSTMAEFNGSTITIGDDAADVINFGSLNFNSTGTVTITEDSSTELFGANSADALLLTSSAGITDQSSTSLSVTNNANLVASLLTLGDFITDNINLGSLTFTIAGHLFLGEDSGTLLFGTSTAGSLELASEGDITDDANADTTITGNAKLIGQNITLGDTGTDAFEAGSLTIIAALDVAITQEDSAIVLDDQVIARSLQLTSETGSITDNANTQMAVVQNASFTAADVITLGDNGGDATNFGSLTFDTLNAAVFIDEDSSTQLAGASQTDSLVLFSAGDLTNANNSSLAVSNQATFFADGINLGNQTTDTINFGSVLFDALADVDLSEDSATVLASGISQAQNLVLSSTGSITNSAGTDLFIADHAAINSEATIELGSETGDFINFGRVTLNSTDDSRLTEDSEIVFTGANSGSFLIARADDGVNRHDITDETGATFNYTVESSFRADNITLGDMATDVLTFADVQFNALGDVFFNEDDAITLGGFNSATNMHLISSGTITNTNFVNFNFDTSGNLRLEGTAITLNDPGSAMAGDTFDTGSLTFQSTGNVLINETSSIVLEGTNTANFLSLEADGAITDLFGTTVITQNIATFFNDDTGAITLGDSIADVYRLGGLTFGAPTQDVTITQDSAIVLHNSPQGQNITLAATDGTSRFDVTDNANTDLTAGGNLSITGRAITLGDDAADSYSVTGTTSLDTTDDINIGVTPATGADSGAAITLNGFAATTPGNLQLAEDDNILLTGRVEASNVTLSAAGSIQDDANFDLDVTGETRLITDGTGGVTLGDQGGNTIETPRLSFTAAGQAVDIETDTNIELFGSAATGNANVAGSLILESAGFIIDDNFNRTDLTVATTAELIANATGNIILGNRTDDQIQFGQLRFEAIGDDVEITEQDGTDLFGVNQADVLELTSGGAITDDDGTTTTTATLTITGDATFNAVSGIDLGGAAETTNFGRVNFNSSGQAVSIVEDSATVLFGHSIFGNANQADSLVLTSAAGITDDSRTQLAITNNASFTTGANADITIGDHRNDTVNFGTLTFNSGAGAASFDEDSSTTYSGTNMAGSLVQVSRGAIGNDANADLAITGDASFDTRSLGDLTLGENANNDIDFGRLEIKTNGRTATVTEDSGTEFFGDSTALNLVLDSAGSITDSPDTEMLITNNLTLTAADAITLADSANDLFWVTDQTDLTANNGDINLGVVPAAAPAALVDSTAIVRIENLEFNATGAVRIKSDFADVNFFGTSASQRLNLETPGEVSDSTTATSVTIGDDALITADSVLLGSNSTGTYQFGDILHVIANTGNVQLGATNGFAVDSGATFHVGRFHVSAAAASLVTLVEDSATILTSTSYVGADTPVLAGNGVAEFNIVSNGSLTDLAGTDLNVDGNANFTATSITLADEATDTLSISGIANLIATADSVEIGVTASTTTDSGAAVDLTEVTFTTLGTDATDSVVIVDDSADGFALTGTSLAFNLTLDLAGALTDTDGTSVTLNNNATISATLITLADDATDVFQVLNQATLTSTTGDLFLGADTRVATQFTDSGALVELGLLNFNSAGQSAIFTD